MGVRSWGIWNIFIQTVDGDWLLVCQEQKKNKKNHAYPCF